MKISGAMVYLVDNGAAYCGEHLGSTARLTGRDISGQEILPITPDVAAQAGYAISCERCGRTPSNLYV